MISRLLFAGLGLVWAASAQVASGPVPAAQGLLERLLPAHARYFLLETIDRDPAGDVFELESRAGKIVLRGNNGVALASALNWYLKYYCRAHVSWCGDQLKLPAPLPAVPEKVRRTSPFRYRYCFNYCAFSYSLAWWDWPQWERMIDWMALHGINMPLAVTGQEAVWLAVGQRLGLKDQQVQEFLVGPAFLPFGWMGCLDGWGGPLPTNWVKRRAELGRRILARERALGMTPVLQGFTGHVPGALTNVFREARLQRLSSWCGFPPTHFIDPLDPLFGRIGKLFIEEQTRQFGTDHLYAADTFIEMQPPSNDPEFLAGMARAVFTAMRAADPAAVWVLQGWLFVNNPSFWQPPQGRALFGAVPDDRLIALDLYCENAPVWSKTEAFYGKPWVWCIIQNFGGAVSLHGALPRMATDLHAALTSPNRGNLSGIGLIFEGLDYNPIVSDFVTDMAWRREAHDLESWARQFLLRRYGRLTPRAEAAWQLLRRTAYTQPARTDSLLCARPGETLALGGHSYDLTNLVAVAEELLTEAVVFDQTDTYQFDVVNITREALAGLGSQRYTALMAALRQKDRQGFEEAARALLELIEDLDTLLATRKEFLLGRYLADARRWAANEEERRLYEWNARNLITLWGPRDSILHEYAARQWSGMFRGFYGRRWQRFIERERAALASNRPFDAAAFEADIRAWEERWTHLTESYATAPTGDPVATAWRLLVKHRAGFGPDAVSLTTGKPVTCSAALPDYLAALANDGRRANTDRYWATDVGQDPAAWWQVDFGQPTTVGRVVVVAYYGDRRHYGFTVQASNDGQTWDLLADRRDNREPSTAAGYPIRFSPRPVRYLRVTLTHNSANTGRHLVEVMAYER
jgi:alpha-N-acetylglucosaminidase